MNLLRGLMVFLAFSSASFAAPLNFQINLSKPVSVTGVPGITLNIGGVSRTASYVSGSGTNQLTFRYAIQPGDFDANGISVTAPLDLNGGSITDQAGNPLPTAFTAYALPNVKIQTYTAAFTSTITSATASSAGITLNKVPVGATFNYTITSSGGAGSVTGSGTTSASPHTVGGIDVSNLPAGTLTVSVTLTTATGGTGAARMATTTPTFTGVLDALPASAAAYSVRRLRNAYTGPLLRVRRDSDNAETDISGNTVGGGLDQTALLSFCGINSCFVKTWYDQSGNGIDAVQAAAAAQPRIVNAGVLESLNGKVAVSFISTNAQSLQTTSNVSFVGAASMNAVSQAFSTTQSNYFAIV
jgi:hypothetical protein